MFHIFPIVGSQMPMMMSNTSELHTSKIQEETAEKSDQFLLRKILIDPSLDSIFDFTRFFLGLCIDVKSPMNWALPASFAEPLANTCCCPTEFTAFLKSGLLQNFGWSIHKPSILIVFLRIKSLIPRYDPSTVVITGPSSRNDHFG